MVRKKLNCKLKIKTILATLAAKAMIYYGYQQSVQNASYYITAVKIERIITSYFI